MKDANKQATTGLYSTGAEAVVPRKIVRNSSLDMIVEHPAETLEKVVAVAENFGGYVETSNSGGSAGRLPLSPCAFRLIASNRRVQKSESLG
jgi:hypothetical protein